MKVVDAGDYSVENLSKMEVIGEDAAEDYEQMKDHIYSQREQRALANMKFKTTDPAKYEKMEKAATDDFLRQLRDLKKFAKDNNL